MERYWVPSIASSAVFGTALADWWVDVHTGGDLAFLVGVLRALVELAGVDEPYVRERTVGFEQAREEFEAVVERAPTNDYALFCLGRALMQLGRTEEARKPLTLAACMNPKRRDYRIYRDRARKAA